MSDVRSNTELQPLPIAAVRPRRDVSPAHFALRAAPGKAGRAVADVSDITDALSVDTDRMIHATVSKLTGGLSPAALGEAYFDWLTHLLSSPGHQARLTVKAFSKYYRIAAYLAECATHPHDAVKPCIQPLASDRRFAAPAWQQQPFNLLSQMFLLQQQWWHNATTNLRGVDKQHERVVEFAARQILDVMSPANFPATNPEVLTRTIETGGANLVQGAINFMEDASRALNGQKPIGCDDFKVGVDVAVTPGKVVYRNRLIELIQYSPSTPNVRAEPILIVPAWIMKYYILDLSPQNSLVRYLVSQGFTVFMVSWKNPGSEDRDLGLEDYRRLGPMDALDAISEIMPDVSVHAAGYCLGGTLLSVAAAAMARDGDHRLKSVTLLAAQTDFADAGELTLFINESQIAFLEDMMWQQGYLDTRQMAGAFQILRSNDLVWSKMVHDYWMGQRRPMSDLMAWNADATRMPYRMHSEYLRQLFLDNDLSQGRFYAGGAPVAISDIKVPIFAIGTERDHVAPWQSVFKINVFADTDVTFLLTSGGHNAGIVSELENKGRSYRVMAKKRDEPYLSPDTWFDVARKKSGSWWPEWLTWLVARSSAANKTPPPMGSARLTPVCDAPGTYVLED